MTSEKPLLVSRLGGVELLCCRHYHQRRRDLIRNYPSIVKKHMCEWSGFFPVNDSALDKFARIYLESVGQADVLGVWYKPGENKIVQHYCPGAKLILPRSIEPYFHEDPWSTALANKKVLVILPFSETVMEQYKKRECLFANKKVLPEFKLITLKAVQSIAGERTRFSDWFEALDFMRDQICKIDFDVAVIGAGAYGLPLAAFVKGLGKKAIHMGGATQIFFGIKGRRWDKHDFISKLYNEHWVRPSESETPRDSEKVEGGCYW